MFIRKHIICLSSRTGKCAALSLLLPAALLLSQDRTTLYEEAVANLQRGDPQRALQILEPLISAEPDEPKGLTLLGMTLSSAGRDRDGIPIFEHALRVRPMYPPALKGLAMAEMKTGDRDAAASHFEQLLTVAPADPVAHAGLGEIAFGQQRFEDAIRHLQQSDPVFRQDPRMLFDYAKANIKLNQTAKAAESLDHIPEAWDAQAHFEAGALLASLKSYDSAARQFKLALPDYPDRYSAGFNLTLALLNAQRYNEAAEAGQTLMAGGYRKAELYNLVAEALEKSGDTKKAYESLRTATQLAPSDETNYIDLIALCLDHKNYDLASEIAGIGLEKIPASERLHLQLGVVLAMKAQMADAKKEFDKAERLAPGKGLPHVALALVMMQTNRSAEAVKDLRGQLLQKPDDFLALWFLGEALNRGGATPGSPAQAEAIAALQKSVRLNPDISQSQELLGKLLAHDGRIDEAIGHLDRAIALDSGNVAAIYQLAQAYSKKGDAAHARPLFAKVSKMKADDRDSFASHGLQQILRVDPQ